MTKLQIDAAVVQQALEFLSGPNWGTATYMDMQVYDDASKIVTSLRAALQQPELQAQAGEPVKLGLYDSQWVNVVNDPVLRGMDKDDAIHRSVTMAERKCIENAKTAIAKKDEALKACVEALGQSRFALRQFTQMFLKYKQEVKQISPYISQFDLTMSAASRDIEVISLQVDAAITKAQEQLK